VFISGRRRRRALRGWSCRQCPPRGLFFSRLHFVCAPLRGAPRLGVLSLLATATLAAIRSPISFAQRGPGRLALSDPPGLISFRRALVPPRGSCSPFSPFCSIYILLLRWRDPFSLGTPAMTVPRLLFYSTLLRPNSSGPGFERFFSSSAVTRRAGACVPPCCLFFGPRPNVRRNFRHSAPLSLRTLGDYLPRVEARTAVAAFLFIRVTDFPWSVSPSSVCQRHCRALRFLDTVPSRLFACHRSAVGWRFRFFIESPHHAHSSFFEHFSLLKDPPFPTGAGPTFPIFSSVSMRGFFSQERGTFHSFGPYILEVCLKEPSQNFLVPGLVLHLFLMIERKPRFFLHFLALPF